MEIGSTVTLTYTGTLTVYYDRTPEEGGKVRILVVK